MAVVDDASGLGPGGDEAVAAIGAVELKDEVVEIVHHVEQFGRAGFQFPQQCAAVDDLAARGADQRFIGGDGRRQRGDAGLGHSATDRSGDDDGTIEYGTFAKE